MASGWRASFPDHVLVPLDEYRAAISALEELPSDATAGGRAGTAARIDAVIGAMTAWLWRMLDELDDGDDG